MPLEQIVISLMGSSKWINVLMFNTPNWGNASEQMRRIGVSANGIRWIEQDFEQFTPLGKFFVIDGNPKDGITADKSTYNWIALKVSLLNINHEAVENQTVHVVIKELHLLLNESTAFNLQCSRCFKELVPVRRYSRIHPMPVHTMEPRKHFCPSDQLATSVTKDEFYYGLNYIVISPKHLAKRVIHSTQHIQCGNCLQTVGEMLDEKVAVKLYVDTLLVGQRKQGKLVLHGERLEHFFRRPTVSQVMLHLLQNAVPISEEKTRLFLNAVRPDGQLYYMLMLMDNSQLHLLRSKRRLMEDLNVTSSYPNDSDSSSATSSGSSNSCSPSNNSSDLETETSGDDEYEPVVKRLRTSRKTKPVHKVKVRGYRGSRINYHIFRSDEEMAAGEGLIEQWRSECTPMRISNDMMLDLLHELNENELLVDTLEQTALNEPEGNISCIIYEPDED